MLSDILRTQDAVKLNLIDNLELKYLDKTEQEILIEIRSHQADRSYNLW